MDVIKGSIKTYKDIKEMIEDDQSAGVILDGDKEWWEGVFYGCYLCGVINAGEKEQLVDLFGEIQDRNIEIMNNGGEEVE